MGELAGKEGSCSAGCSAGRTESKGLIGESRLALDVVKRFKALRLVVKMDDVAYPLWASPNKPENIRARDGEATLVVQVLKDLLKVIGLIGEERELDINYAQCRVGWGAQHDRSAGKLQHREEILKHLCLEIPPAIYRSAS